MASPTTSIRLVGNLNEEIIRRSDNEQSKSGVLQRDALRYYAILPYLLPKFSVDEASFLVGVLNGCKYGDVNSIKRLWKDADYAVYESNAAHCTIDGNALVTRLQAMDVPQYMAIIDAVERYWCGPYHKDGPMEERLREVGLVK